MSMRAAVRRSARPAKPDSSRLGCVGSPTIAPTPSPTRPSTPSMTCPRSPAMLANRSGICIANSETGQGQGRSGRIDPVRLLVGIGQVIGEPARGGVPVDELVEGKLAGQRARPPDVAGELGLERLDQALHEQALPGREGAFLPAG